MAKSSDLYIEAETSAKARSRPGIGSFSIAAEVVALALFYSTLAWVWSSFAKSGDSIAAIWPPSAVLLAILLLSRPSHWPVYITAALLTSVGIGVAQTHSVAVAVKLAVATVSEATFAAFLLQRFFPQDREQLINFRRLPTLFGVALLASATTGAIIGALAFYEPTSSDFWHAWLNWWIASTTAVVVITPLLLTWREAREHHDTAKQNDAVELLVTLSAILALTIVIFSQPFAPLLFLFFPLAIWVGVRFGVFPTAFLCLAVSLIAIGMTWIGHGPVAEFPGTVDLKLRLLQGFIAVTTLTSLTIAIAWEGSRKVQRELALSEQRFRDFAESASDRFWETDKAHRFTWVSRPPRYSQRSIDDVLGKSRMELAGGDRIRDEIWRSHCEDLDAHRPFRDFLYSARDRDGHVQYRRVSGKPVFDEKGEFLGYRGTVSSVTQSVEAELLASQLGRIIEESLNEIYVIDAESLQFILVNRGARQNLGYGMEELRQMSPADICFGMSLDQWRNHFRQLDAGSRSKLVIEPVFLRKDGTTYDVEAHLQRVTVGQIPPVYIVIALDTTRRKKIYAELAEKSLLLHTTLDSMAQGLSVYDSNLRLAAFNQKYVELLGYPPGFIEIGGRLEDHLRDCAQRGLFGDGDPEAQVAERLLSARQREAFRQVYHRPDGVVVVANRRPMPQGGFVTTFSDITERETTEEALRRSTAELQNTKASFEAAIKASRQILYDWNTRDDTVKWDGETELILGYTPKELEGLPDWLQLIHPDDRRRFVRERAQAVMAQDVVSLEYRVAHKDGRYISVADRGVFLHGTPGGAKRVVGFISDVSLQKATEEALRQSDKLLAVGQLTGGIAHDFNNLLAIIQGNLELLKEDLSDDLRHERHIQTAMTAARRGAALTQRLLAFARRQPLQPQSIVLNDLVKETSELLQRSLDASIALEMQLSDDLWRTRIDPSGLENALLNLALNARDAMPKGGKMIIETQNTYLDEDYVRPHRDLRPGEYVMLAVSDTGIGMPPEVRDRVFEPFFTTKEIGRGNGLGLPMVYGFVKQSRGHVQIYSELGIGTTVKVYLPRDESEAPQQAQAVPEPEQRSAGSGECVLVVEDNEDVRILTNMVLTGLGYRTVLAADADTALATLKETPDIDVLFTDIVLPGGTNGFELAQRARAIRPGLKVLYTSGYTNNAIMQNNTPDDIVLIAKPYRKADLALKMRQVLTKESTDGQH